MRTIGWVVDVQNDFMEPNGLLYVKQGPDDTLGAESIYDEIKAVVDYLALTAEHIVFTADHHMPGDRELSDDPDFVSTFPPHCMAGTRGEKIHACARAVPPNVTIYPDGPMRTIEGGDDILILKNEFDVFAGNPHTDAVIRSMTGGEQAHFIVCGVATDVCVDFAVRGLASRGHKVTVVQRATYGLGIKPDYMLTHEWVTEFPGLVTVVPSVYYIND